MAKKILIAILALILLMSGIGVLPVIAEETEADVKVVERTKAVQVLAELDCFKYTDDLLDGNMTRAEFADIISVISGRLEAVNYAAWYEYFYGKKDDFEETYDNSGRFADVPKNYWAYNSVEAVYEAGYMNGGEGNLFRPDNAILFEEAVAVIIRLVNSELLAKAEGGWPAGYIKVAANLGLTKGYSPSKGQPMTREMVAQLLYNAFNVTVMDNGLNGMVVEPSKRRTFLNVYMGLDYTQGIVTANGSSTLTTPTNRGDNYFEIDGVQYINNNPYYANFIGREIEAYYVCDGEYHGEIKYAFTIDDDEYLAIDLSKYHSFNNGVLTYETENGKIKNINISGKRIIYNGEAISSYDNTLFDATNGTVLISDRNTDIVIATVYENVYVTSVDAGESLVYDGLSGTRLDLSEDKYRVEIYDRAGQKLDFSFIKQGTVLSVVQSSKLRRVYISDKTATGKINGISENDGVVFTIGNDSYKVSSELKNHSVFANLEIKKDVMAYINIFDEISFAEILTVTGVQHAYFFNTRINTDEERVISKILDQTGKIKNYYLAEKKVELIAADGTVIKDADNVIYNHIKDHKGYARINLNSKQEIIGIEIPGQGLPQVSDNGRIRQFPISGEIQYYNNIGFNNRAMVNDDTVVFVIPADETDYDSYKVASKSVLKHTLEYNNIKFYGSTYGSRMTDAIEVKATLNERISTNVEYIYVVKELFVTLNEDGEAIYAALLSNGTTEKTVYDGDDNARGSLSRAWDPGQQEQKPVKEGDLIMCITDESNRLVDVYRIFDPEQLNITATSGRKGGIPGITTDLFYAPKTYVDTISDVSDLANYNFHGTTTLNSTVGLSNPSRFNTMQVTYDAAGNPVYGYNNYSPHVFYNSISNQRLCLGDVYYKGRESFIMTTQDLTSSAYIPNGIPDSEIIEKLDDLGVPVEITNTSETSKNPYVPVYYSENWAYNSTYKSVLKTVITYGERGFEVREATNEDIRDYVSAGADCSRVISVIRQGTPSQLVVINDNR